MRAFLFLSFECLIILIFISYVRSKIPTNEVQENIRKYINSATIVPGKYIFYGNLENLGNYKSIYHTLMVKVQFKNDVNISYSTMVDDFNYNTNSYDDDNIKVREVTTINSLQNANKTQLYGLTRFTCVEKDNVRVFESYPVRKGINGNPIMILAKGKIPRYLIPITKSTQKRDISNIVRSKLNKNEYAALIISKDPDILPKNSEQQSSCFLDFLSIKDQQKQDRYGKKHIIDTKNNIKLFGRINLMFSTSLIKTIDNENTQHHNDNKKVSRGVNRNIIDAIIGLTGRKALNHHTAELNNKMKLLDDQCLKLPGIPGKITYSNDNNKLHNDSTNSSQGIMKRRRRLFDTPAQPAEEEVQENRKFDLFIPVLQQIIPFLISLVGIEAGGVGQKAKRQVLGEGVQTASADIAHQVYVQLFQALKAHMLETALPPLTETIGENVGESVIELVKSSIISSIPDKIKMPIAEVLTKNVQNAVPTMIDDHTPKYTAVMLAKSINHRLPRSLAHAIVPSLIHSLTHNPMEDYYCYYCFHHKTYCQYCNYGPEQLYYAMYYTGFYSTYYTDYYVDWMYRKMNEDMESGADADGNSGEEVPTH